MKVVHFYESNKQEHWLEEINKGDWGACEFLHELLSKETFFDAVGADSEVLLLTDGDKLISFCTYAEKDDIQPTELTPWIGFVYTFPQYRGHRYMGQLFEEIKSISKEKHVDKVYISTNHVGLYEKYGCEYFTQMKDMNGELSRVYVKRIN